MHLADNNKQQKGTDTTAGASSKVRSKIEHGRRIIEGSMGNRDRLLLPSRRRESPQIYELVTKHFLACCSKDAVGHQTKASHVVPCPTAGRLVPIVLSCFLRLWGFVDEFMLRKRRRSFFLLKIANSAPIMLKSGKYAELCFFVVAELLLQA